MPEAKSISEIFNKDSAFVNLRNFVMQADIVTMFVEIFPELKGIAEAVKIERGILLLRVENSIWRSELRFKQKFIVERINKHFEYEIIKCIKFIA